MTVPGASLSAATLAITPTTPTSGRATSSPAWTRACKGSAWERGGGWLFPHTWPTGRTEQVKGSPGGSGTPGLQHPLLQPRVPAQCGSNIKKVLAKWGQLPTLRATTIPRALGIVGRGMADAKAPRDGCGMGRNR